MKRSRDGRRGSSVLDEGFTLVELMVAAAVAAMVLGAGYGWLWNLAAFAERTDDRAQAASLAGAASRIVAADVQACVRVAAPPSGRDPTRALALVHDHAGVTAEFVLIVWDPGRGVVWRNSSGTYIADHITQFSVAYVLTGGELIEGAGMSSSDWTTVRSVQVDLAATVGSVTIRRSVEASVGPS